MKKLITLLLLAVVLVIVVILGFVFVQINEQKLAFTSDLQYRTHLLGDGLRESVEPYYLNHSAEALQNLVTRFADRDRLVGIAVYDKEGGPITVTEGLGDVRSGAKVVDDAMNQDKELGDFAKINNQKLYVFSLPLHNGDAVVGSLVIVQDASYIDDSISDVWKRNIVRILLQVLLFAALIFLIIRLVVVRQLSGLTKAVKSARTGTDFQSEKTTLKNFFFSPLSAEISKLAQSLTHARSVASEEARLRLEKFESPWTEARLKEFIKAYLKDHNIFILFKGEPYTHKHGKKGIEYTSQAGGVLTALEPVMEACGGMWIAHGNGDADKEVVDEYDKIMVPPEHPKYTLKRVWLTEEQVRGYNKGYSAEGLYPLCFNTHIRPVFRNEDWEQYKIVNNKFADVLLEEIKNVSNPVVLVNEYHFALLPKIIKDKRPDARVGIFWHTPWPSAEAFGICPQRKELLEGMLGADIIGFHTQQFCNNFIDTVGKEVEALINFDRFTITKNDHISSIRSFPVGVTSAPDSKEKGSLKDAKQMLEDLGIKTKYFGLGADRLDYVKGIPERFKGIEVFLDKNPEYRRKFTFLQIASPCRGEVEKYQEYQKLVVDEAKRINEKFGTKEWAPIVLELKQYSREELDSLYKVANVCLVTSLHDGMNLVCKEFVAARDDEKGTLILSKFTGASHEMKGAIIVNPYSIDEIAEAIKEGLTMPVQEQIKRMKSMRSGVKGYNIYRWAAELLKAIADI